MSQSILFLSLIVIQKWRRADKHDNESANVRRSRWNSFAYISFPTARIFEIFYKVKQKCLVIKAVMQK